MYKRAAIPAYLIIAVLFSGCADDPSVLGPEVRSPGSETLLGAFPAQWTTPLRVMSRNLYLGGDIGPILSASDPAEIPGEVGQAWATIRSTNFSQRAPEIAREIASARPDVIGLQEVALFRVQSPGDFLIGNPQDAETVAFDYLAILMDALERHGMQYEVAASVENIDIELPAATSPTTFDDVRYTDRDVVLVRRGIQVDGAVSGRYSVNLAFPVAGAVPVTIFRGWNRVDLTHRGTAYHFVNTHLETDESGAPIQELQAQELIGMLSSVEVPTFVVGDLNGTPEGGTATYQTLVEAGFEDLWASAQGGQRGLGFTCCFDPDLQGGTLFERIDYIFARAPDAVGPRVHSVRLVGAGPLSRRVGTLRPSDHAGLDANVSFLQMPST